MPESVVSLISSATSQLKETRTLESRLFASSGARQGCPRMRMVLSSAWRHERLSTSLEKCKMPTVCFDCSYNAAPVSHFLHFTNFTLYVKSFEEGNIANVIQNREWAKWPPFSRRIILYGFCQYFVLSCARGLREKEAFKEITSFFLHCV